MMGLKALISLSALVCVISTVANADVPQSDGELRAIASKADSIPMVEPKFASDCMTAYKIYADLAESAYVDVHGNDFKASQSAKQMANIWGLVAYRESQRTGVDIAKAKGPFTRKIMRSSLSSRTRGGSFFDRVEKQLETCQEAAKSEPAKVSNK